MIKNKNRIYAANLFIRKNKLFLHKTTQKYIYS